MRHLNWIWLAISTCSVAMFAPVSLRRHLQLDFRHRLEGWVVSAERTFHDSPRTANSRRNDISILGTDRFGSPFELSTLTTKYVLSLTVPLLRPFGSLRTMPAHLPGANSVNPRYAISPRIFRSTISTFRPKRRCFGSVISSSNVLTLLSSPTCHELSEINANAKRNHCRWKKGLVTSVPIKGAEEKNPIDARKYRNRTKEEVHRQLSSRRNFTTRFVFFYFDEYFLE